MEPLSGSIATQLPEGVDEKDLRGSASVGSKSTIAITVCQIVFQLSMKGSINQMMTLVFYLQLAKTISFYELKFPGNAEIYLQEVRKLVDFESIAPEAVI